jgi:hypothetical protein
VGKIFHVPLGWKAEKGMIVIQRWRMRPRERVTEERERERERSRSRERDVFCL